MSNDESEDMACVLCENSAEDDSLLCAECYDFGRLYGRKALFPRHPNLSPQEGEKAHVDH